jgi:hypothetical protein
MKKIYSQSQKSTIIFLYTKTFFVYVLIPVFEGGKKNSSKTTKTKKIVDWL